jgi:aspartate aminotransferase-like enzyme
MLEEGLENSWTRHQKNHVLLKVKARSLKLTGEIPGIADKHFCVPE